MCLMRAVTVVACVFVGATSSTLAEPRSSGYYVHAAIGSERPRELGDEHGQTFARYRSDGGLSIQAYGLLDQDTEEILYISIPDATKIRRHRLGASSDGAWARYTVHRIHGDTAESFGTNDRNQGWVKLDSLDGDSGVASGAFEFVGAYGGRTLRVGKGRFRVKLYSQ